MAGRGMNWHRATWQTKMRRQGSEQIETPKHSRKRKRRRRNVRISRDGLAQHALKTHTERTSVLIPKQSSSTWHVQQSSEGKSGKPVGKTLPAPQKTGLSSHIFARGLPYTGIK
jgi:hypothetical protein